MNQWSQFLLWNFVYDCMFIVILTDGELGAISRETVYYMRRPFRIIYLLMAGRKPIFSKTVCHIWPWNSQPWLFYITFLYLFSIILYLLSVIYYLLSKSVIYYLLPIIHYLMSIYLLSIIYYLDFIAINCWSSALVDVMQHLYCYGCWKHENCCY